MVTYMNTGEKNKKNKPKVDKKGKKIHVSALLSFLLLITRRKM